MKVNPQRCPQNHACPAIKVCPVDAISQKGHGLPVIDENKCINCGACADFCPMKAISE
ncbi:MAG TPA: 4Fe-4S binding protein [Spirochaetota bacterium]|nr:4Fe-4S binding protein [Spirochaetota bacterium]